MNSMCIVSSSSSCWVKSCSLFCFSRWSIICFLVLLLKMKNYILCVKKWTNSLNVPKDDHTLREKVKFLDLRRLLFLSDGLSVFVNNFAMNCHLIRVNWIRNNHFLFSFLFYMSHCRFGIAWDPSHIAEWRILFLGELLNLWQNSWIKHLKTQVKISGNGNTRHLLFFAVLELKGR